MQKDAEAYVKTYDKCQRFNNIIRQPTEELTPMMALWPFAQWGLDIMGPFPIEVWQLKFQVVGIDYFTKWVEVEALTTIIEKNVRSFFWRCIICRFGIPSVLVSDNGKQFNNDSFWDFCSLLGIRNHYSSLTHPQANGQAKLRINPCSRLSRLGLRGQRAYGLKNYRANFGHTERRWEHPQERHHSG